MGKEYKKNDACIYDANKFCDAPIWKHDLGLCVDFCIPSEGRSWEYQKMSKREAEKFIKKERSDDAD